MDTKSPSINLVWLKRDLRLSDHHPLEAAEQSGLPYLIIYILEPSIVQLPTTALRHLQFQYHSIQKMNQELTSFGRTVFICYGEAIEVIQSIQEKYRVEKIFSYQESGIPETFARDRTIHTFLKTQNIRWEEFQKDGVIRGIKDRKGWDKKWKTTLSGQIIPNSFSRQAITFTNPWPLPTATESKLKLYPSSYQPPGTDIAFRYLHSFVEKRASNYSRHISKPLESRSSCARISPHLAWGNLSNRQAWQYLREAKSISPHRRGIQGAMTRLQWRDHFIQKFENECQMAKRHLNRGYDNFPFIENEAQLQAWKEGRTGVPLVDACMQCLKTTGWINFRMRAMLVSFLTHHLLMDWRKASSHLAQLFLDYEPGIHYPQLQMQAGTTGYNTIRIYNPIKQQKEHDSEGVFVKQWLGDTYQLSPIIDVEKQIKEHRKLAWSWRDQPEVKSDLSRILKKHVR
jgi:deoxyribodipyrimidine photo-lyase